MIEVLIAGLLVWIGVALERAIKKLNEVRDQLWTQNERAAGRQVY